jgi:hypothetical protein
VKSSHLFFLGVAETKRLNIRHYLQDETQTGYISIFISIMSVEKNLLPGELHA